VAATALTIEAEAAEASSPAQASPATSWVVRGAARFGRRFVGFGSRCFDARHHSD
jgi:hypothetical protein